MTKDTERKNNMKEYDLPKGETVEKWVSENWETTGMEYYLKDQDDGTMYHFFPAFDFLTMKDIGFSDKDIKSIDYILAPLGDDTPNGDIDTWYMFNKDGERVN